MTPRTRPDGAADAGPSIAVVDSRPLFGRAMATVFEGAGLPVVALPPQSVAEVPGSVQVALVALTVSGLARVIVELIRCGCRVIVYGAANQPSLGVAVRAGAVSFVPEDGGAVDFEHAVATVVRGVPQPLLGSVGNRFDELGFAELTRREREVLLVLLGPAMIRVARALL